MCDTMKVTFLNMWLCGHVGNQCVKLGSFRRAESLSSSIGDNVENQREGRGQSYGEEA